MCLVSLWPAGGDMPFSVCFCELANSYIPELWVISEFIRTVNKIQALQTLLFQRDSIVIKDTCDCGIQWGVKCNAGTAAEAVR